MGRRYSGYIPEENEIGRHGPQRALRDLADRLMGDFPPADHLELAGAIAELIAIVDVIAEHTFHEPYFRPVTRPVTT